MGRELDRVADISESIRPALHVRPRVEGMKRTQDKELGRSLLKVQSSQSPDKRSPYRSPGQY